MDNQRTLFELKRETKIIESQEEIENNVDSKTGQVSFITKEVEIRAILKEEMQPILEKSALLIEKNDRLTSAFEKAIPHFQNKMMGNEDEAYLAYAYNPEQADVIRVSSENIPADAVYTMISADLASAFGCKTCYVSYLLKDLNLWDDHRYTKDDKVFRNSTVKRINPAILDKVYKKLPEFLSSEKFKTLTEKRQTQYLEIYETMKFYRG